MHAISAIVWNSSLIETLFNDLLLLSIRNSAMTGPIPEGKKLKEK